MPVLFCHYLLLSYLPLFKKCPAPTLPRSALLGELSGLQYTVYNCCPVPWDNTAPESPVAPPFDVCVQARQLFVSPLAFVGSKPLLGL